MPAAGAARARRLGAVAALGFASGLPFALSHGTLQAWLATLGVDIRVIGLYGLVGLPYTLKFLWAPMLDRWRPPWLGRRRGWMLAMQLAAALALAAIAASDPAVDPAAVALLALLLVFASATQDIAIDAWRADVLAPAERGAGAALGVAGYRIGLVVSGAGALVLAAHMGFAAVYGLMAGLMAATALASLAAPAAPSVHGPVDLLQAYRDPLLQFLRRPDALALIALVILYKLGDAFAVSLTSAFLIGAAGYDTQTVGIVGKGFGLAVTILGGLSGGAIMFRLRLYRALMLFGVLQAITNLGYLALVHAGPDTAALAAVIGLDNLAAGMGSAAFVALLMACCDARYSAAQFALLTALAALGRELLGPTAGFLVDAWGWQIFFLASFGAALPGLVLLRRLRHLIDGLDFAKA